MRKISFFGSPLFLGFDHFEEVVDKVSRESESYPPYNIEKISDLGLRITLAVAGFNQGDLSVSIEDNQLVIRGQQQNNKDDERSYIYRGIASRQFQRNFVLADGIVVIGSYLDNGLLNIELSKPAPKVKVTEISIQTKDAVKRNRGVTQNKMIVASSNQDEDPDYL